MKALPGASGNSIAIRIFELGPKSRSNGSLSNANPRKKEISCHYCFQLRLESKEKPLKKTAASDSVLPKVHFSDFFSRSQQDRNRIQQLFFANFDHSSGTF